MNTVSTYVGRYRVSYSGHRLVSSEAGSLTLVFLRTLLFAVGKQVLLTQS